MVKFHKRFHIRGGALTTAGGVVQASATWYRLDGVALACEGDLIVCPTCSTTGHIQCVSPRIPDSLNGKQLALSDDICICKCQPPPKLIAEQTVKYQIIQADGANDGEATKHSVPKIYDERPRLIAPPTEGLPYLIVTEDGRQYNGRVHLDGLLPRVDTPDEEDYTVFWGDEALARTMGDEDA